MNYMEELQKINEDYQKAKLVIQSCVYAPQLQNAINYSTNFVQYHCTRLGITKKYSNKLWWFFCEHEKKEKNKIIEYIDLCVNDLQELVEDKKEEVQEYYDTTRIGYGDPNLQLITRIQQDVKKWEDKKKKDRINDVHRKTKREELQVN